MTKRKKETLNTKRIALLTYWTQWTELPLIILGGFWLILLIVEMIRGIEPLLEIVLLVIWLIFILDFIVQFSLTPSKIHYLKSHLLTLISLVIPAFRLLRIFRLFRVIQATRSLYLIRIASSIRRMMYALKALLGRHGLSYVIALTFIVIFVAAAGIKAFEPEIEHYGDALWWAAMMVTTMGTDFWPKTVEGRILSLGLAIYSFAIFGYITANVATFLIEKNQEAKSEKKEILEAIEKLKQEIKAGNSKK